VAEVIELFGCRADADHDWRRVVREQRCPYAAKRCFKIRKSTPSISIGTCVASFNRAGDSLIICPNRFLAHRQVFSDCLPLLRHRAGNELHVVPEVRIPGGNVDYFLVSSRDRVPIDFVGIEFQAVDTTGSVWPARQQLLREAGLDIPPDDDAGTNPGANWKMTAKTILVQLHHKVETFEALGKKCVLVLQDRLMEYMTREFAFGHLESPALDGDSMRFHSYSLQSDDGSLVLSDVLSTNMAGIAAALSLGSSAEMRPKDLIQRLQEKLGDHTLWQPV